MMSGNLGEMFLQGGWVMWPLLLLSVVSWAVILERTYVFMTLRPKLEKLAQSVRQAIRSGDLNAARSLCHQEGPLLSGVFLCSLDPTRARDVADRAIDRNKSKLNIALKKNLWMLGTIGSASPFIGLLGTVVGIIRSFHHMSLKGTGGFSVVSAGISEALIATAAGLIVAIVAVFAFNLFTTLASQTAASLRIALDEIFEETVEAKLS